MSSHIRKTKAFFTLSVFAVIFMIGLGVEVFQGRHVESVASLFEPFKLRYAYARESGDGVAAAFGRVFDPSETVPASQGAGGVPVLLYHGIVKRADRFGLTEETFTDQMFALKRAGYRTVTPDEFERFLAEGAPLPEKSFLLTFDDGRLDSYVKADPVLKALGFHALMFVAVESSLPSSGDRQTFYINAKDIRNMLDSGRWSIGSHALQLTGGLVPVDASGTLGNFLSSKAWIASRGALESDEAYAERITRELAESRERLQSIFETRVATFSYPFGDYGHQRRNVSNATSTIAAIISSQYEMAFRQVWPYDGEYTLNYRDTDRRYLKRFETPTRWSGEQLVAFLERAEDKRLPFRDSFTRDSGWQAVWGEVSRTGDGLLISASTNTAGAATFVDGAKTWKNYVFNAAIERRSGSHVSLLLRYRDSKNYVACTYGQGRVKIEHVSDGHSFKLAESKVDESAASVFSAGADGGAFECLLDGLLAVRASAETTDGGIGIKIWNETPGIASALVTHVSVTPLP